ncbi:MAG: hypothetical protein ACD_2C00181G0003 [uncultured bacterium (gcode 4)]|uniref:Uncharacterized protein n=1 Tax=uncultured bacterium (gcode 4) TaxID=1234023 RepID=K2H0Q2_9BACT|nr:MAG: hypothetical protein ACD_2C00181G0003 [uncultured bacterium (gcode 4)]
MLVDNFKFKQLLEESGLSFSEKYDISNIFNVLSDERKIDILNKWPLYLNEIFKIRNESLEKRKENLTHALNNIEKIVNEAILRKRDEDERKSRESAERQEINRTAFAYDQMKKANDLQSLLRKQQNGQQ